MQTIPGAPSSYDIIGDILILEIPEGHEKNEGKIGKHFLEKHKNIKVVLKKVGKHSGKHRTQKLKVIAGEKRKTTQYKENGVVLNLNVESSYFSPRSGTERQRVAKLVKPGEEVLVMFSGIAPYPLVIAKLSKPKSVYGIEINPKAHEFAKQNVMLNKFQDVIKPYKGDVQKVLPKLKKKFDRIVMPLPKTAEKFLPLAKKYAKKNATIHFYDFEKDGEFDKGVEKVKKIFPKVKDLKIVRCGQYAPRVSKICVDFKAP